MKKILFLLSALIFMSNFAMTQVQQSQPIAAPTPSTTPPPNPCLAPEFRQFDFWVGVWTVANSAGQVMANSEITREANGCAIRESWMPGNGNTGTSLNYYDRTTRKWHQLWVGAGGGILHLTGGLEGQAMVMTGERQMPQGRVMDKISYTPLPDGRVRQQWDISTDGGQTWRTSFLGFYSRRR